MADWTCHSRDIAAGACGGTHAADAGRRAAPVTLVCLAPLTNIAVFLRMYPALHAKIAAIMVMGGTLAAHGAAPRRWPSSTCAPIRRPRPWYWRAASTCASTRWTSSRHPFRREEAAALAASDPPGGCQVARAHPAFAQFLRPGHRVGGRHGHSGHGHRPGRVQHGTVPVTVELGVSAARSDRHRPAHARAAHRGDDWWTTSPAEVDVISPPWTRNAAARSCAAAWLRPG
ncbi:MAG: nucleoside hydrolase [Caldilineaceae bacterium]